MIVRGIDPGPSSLGWCDLDHASDAAWFVGLGEVSVDEWERLLLGADAIAIERAYGLRTGPRPSIQQLKKTVENLLLTNWVACQIVEAAKRAGVRVFEVDQAAARRGAGVQFHRAGDDEGDIEVDKQIEIILRETVRGWPPGDRSTNKHERDAGIYSMHGAYLLACESKEA